MDEALRPGADPADEVQRLAREKALAVAGRLPLGRWVLGADTLVVLGTRILGKPKDDDEAEAMLAALSGRRHEVLTGLALVPSGTSADPAGRREGIQRSGLTFRALPADEVRAYVRSGEGRDKAGAYALQGAGRAFVVAIEGPEDNVVGLPVDLLRTLAAGLGVLGGGD